MLKLNKEKYGHKDFYLKKLKVDEVTEKYLGWLEDPEVTEFLQVRHYKNDLESLKKYVKSFDGGSPREIFGVYFKDNDEHIGNASIYNIDTNNGTFDFGYFIGEKEYWGKGPGLSVCIIILRICFEELGLRKVFTYVEGKNLRSRFVLQKIGFSNEAVLKEKIKQGDEYIDSIVYGLSRKEWLEKCVDKFKE